MAQIFATDFGWSRCFPMTCQSKAHEALGLLFAWDGVPPNMIIDNSKEMKLGDIARKCKEAHCYLQSTKPYSLWSDSTIHEIRECKKSTARKLMQSAAPLWLCCFALKYELYVCLHTTHDIYQFDGHVPETVVSGKTADIDVGQVFHWPDTGIQTRESNPGPTG